MSINIFEVYDLVKDFRNNYDKNLFLEIKKWSLSFFPDLENFGVWLLQYTNPVNTYILCQGKCLRDFNKNISTSIPGEFLELDRNDEWIYGVTKKSYIDNKNKITRIRICLFLLKNEEEPMPPLPIEIKPFTLRFFNGVKEFKKVIKITTISNRNLLYLIVQEVKKLVSLTNKNIVWVYFYNDNENVENVENVEKRITISKQYVLNNYGDNDILDIKIKDTKFDFQNVYETYM